ncbi:hypothetical protein COW83_00440 [Candidatus Collierbacteria bacterium CG22_combo_CG10-13_8_21_14_all_43_12]|uniref:Radical SAM core domain-containing protein n=2 Tax=Candidatus Collieribacteriota TaxID=1752725 RepID=A0A2H0DWC2_9BACT|nr:MAG: hypothetical protein COW83_00440 [Candidatus Collierbacteria bacterium CG22_combo_CG10-13_8_21_14_all_43_12]PJB48746.1 MAG: hypothetical protein CO104_00660 [Candidatus Collierbacteria bacterium CG_4_9_14_3_um_filter_43_16]
MLLKRRFLKARFFLTNSCTYNCVYCHNEGMGDQKTDLKVLDVDDYIFLAQVLKDNFQLKCITLTGGDPFMYRDFSLLVKKLEKLDIELVALTKGVPTYRWLNSEPEVFKNLDFVYFSIDTLDRDEFAKTCRVSPSVFDLGIAALDKLVSMGVKVRVNCVVKPNDTKEAEKVLSMIEFVKKHKVQELRFIELVDLDNVREPFVEMVIKEAGFNIKVPNTPYDKVSLKRNRIVLEDGFEFLVIRCMCSVTLFTGEVTCFSQDLYLDSFGRVNTCLEWEVDKNPNVSHLAELIKSRNKVGLVEALDNIKNGQHICPALITTEKRESIKAGLQLGTYR